MHLSNARGLTLGGQRFTSLFVEVRQTTACHYGLRSAMSEAAARGGRVETANELAERRTNLAIKRTALGADRTLMAWVRTSLSMIGFGFTIYKFLRELAQLENSKLPDNGPRNLGLTLVALGTVSLTVATLQNWSLMQELKRHASLRARFSLVRVVAITITVLGVLVFFSMVAHMGPF